MNIMHILIFLYLASFGAAQLTPDDDRAKQCYDDNPSKIYNPGSGACVSTCEAYDLIEDSVRNYCLTDEQYLSLHYDYCIEEFTLP